MSETDDAIRAFEEAEEAPVRRVTLPELHVVAGKGEAAAPPTQAEYDAHDTRGHSGLADLAETLLPVYDTDPERRAATAGRMRTRLQHAIDDPTAALFGAAEGASLGGADEGWGALTARPEVVAGVTGSRAGIARESRPAHTYREGQQEAETAIEGARERDPEAFGVGELGGTVGGALAAAPLETAIFGAEAATALPRVARGLATGLGYGGASGGLHSEATIEDSPMELAGDTSEGALLGLATAAPIAAGGEAVRGLARHGRRLAEGADLARVASVAPGRTISRTDPTIAQFSSHPGGIEGQAERLRRMRIVSPAATSRDVYERAGSEYERIGDEVLGPIRERVAEGGPVRAVRPRHGPDLEGAAPRVDEEAAGAPSVTDPLYDYADELARSPDATDRSFAPSVREQADAMLDAWGDHVPYEEAEAQLRRMGGRTQWVSPATGQPVRPPTEIRQEVYRRMRAALDDLAEPRIGADDVGRFREGRLDAQTARTARDLAEARMGRDAQSAPIGLIDSSLASAAGAAGAGPVGTAATALASRGIRGRSGALRATGLDLVRSILDSGAMRRLGAYGPLLQSALQRGAPSLTAAHATLMRSDPEYAAMVEEAESAEPEDPEATAAAIEMFESLTDEASP